MQNLERIDDYFQGRLLPEEKAAVEKRLSDDPAFAGEAAFYLCALQAAGEQGLDERKERLRELYLQHKRSKNGIPSKRTPLKKLWAGLAAAAVVAALAIGYFVYVKTDSPQQRAERYLESHLNLLSVEMSGEQDGLQTALGLYNAGKREEALRLFEKLAADTAEVEAAKYAGIVSLQLKNYDRALRHFLRLENYPNLYSNPGKFYRALTLMRRNAPGDKAEAETLLRQVVAQNLDGKETAQQWLNKW